MMRSYTLGLPVIVSVDDDGRVTYWVDLSEADDLHEANDNAADPEPEEVVDEDAKTVRAALRARWSTFTDPVEV